MAGDLEPESNLARKFSAPKVPDPLTQGLDPLFLLADDSLPSMESTVSTFVNALLYEILENIIIFLF